MLLVPFWARFSSDVNLWENQVVALFCIKWDSSQSFPRVTLGLNLLHHFHGNQRPACECGCLLNPLLASFPSSVFPLIKNDLLPFALTHSRSHPPTFILCPHFLFQHPPNQIFKSSIQFFKNEDLLVIAWQWIDLFRQDQADFNGHGTLGKPKRNLPSSLASLINTLFENTGQPDQILYFHPFRESALWNPRSYFNIIYLCIFVCVWARERAYGWIITLLCIIE